MRALAVLLLAGLLASCAPTAIPAEPVGVVLMHGRFGAPDDMAPVARALAAAGIRTISPQMTWSLSRAFDTDVDGSVDEIAAAVAQLRAGGARRVALVGHSLGAAATLHYAALRHDVVALAMIAPGFAPETGAFAANALPALVEARRLVAAGQGEVPVRFAYRPENAGADLILRTKARIFADWHSPDSEIVMPANAPRVPANLPVLWIQASGDGALFRSLGRGYAFAWLPSNGDSRFEEIEAAHQAAPAVAAPHVRDWLVRELR